MAFEHKICFAGVTKLWPPDEIRRFDGIPKNDLAKHQSELSNNNLQYRIIIICPEL